jgi:chromosome segregation ATPase
MPYDTYNLLVNKLTKAQVWNLNTDELCDEFDKILESEVQDKINTYEEVCKRLRQERDENEKYKSMFPEHLKALDELKKKIQIERDYNIRFRNENRELKDKGSYWESQTELEKVLKEKFQNENRELKNNVEKLTKHFFINENVKKEMNKKIIELEKELQEIIEWSNETLKNQANAIVFLQKENEDLKKQLQLEKNVSEFNRKHAEELKELLKKANDCIDL